MNPVRRKVWLLAGLLIYGLPLIAGKTKTVQKEYYTNGNIRAVIITVVTTPMHADLFNFYKQTKILRTEFDSVISRKTKETVRITKLGRGGKPCYEIYYKEIDYDKNGRRTHYEKSHCDKGRSKIKEYENGEVSFISIQRRKRWLWW